MDHLCNRHLHTSRHSCWFPDVLFCTMLKTLLEGFRPLLFDPCGNSLGGFIM